MVYAVILAGGQGTRIQGFATPKQFIEIDGITLLERVTTTFLNHPAIDSIIVVVPILYHAFSIALLKHLTKKPIHIIGGGSSRQASTKAAIDSLQDRCNHDDIIIIHDAARVLVTSDIIDRGLQSAIIFEATTAALLATDTIMTITEHGTITTALDRQRIINVQTPQLFRYNLIQAAHHKTNSNQATDDISLVLDMTQVGYFLGSEQNFKVTTQADLLKLQYYLHEVNN